MVPIAASSFLDVFNVFLLAIELFGGGPARVTQKLEMTPSRWRSTRVGYTGGQTGHAEAVEIVLDPARISYRDILEFFFQIHDPTTKDRQGNDFDSSYRSEIFATSDEQHRVAQLPHRETAA